MEIIQIEELVKLTKLPSILFIELINKLSILKSTVGIFLAGSSATGELIWKNDILISDLEIGILVDSYKNRKEIKYISKELSKKYKIDLELFMISKGRLKNCSPKNISFRKHSPNIFMYDLTYSSKWFYLKNQNNIEYQKCFQSSQLSDWEGLRLIINRYSEGSKYIIPYLNNEYIDNQIELNRWLIKLIIAVTDALLIHYKKYEIGYLSRYNRLKQENYLNINRNYIHFIDKSYLSRKGEKAMFYKKESSDINNYIRETIFFILNAKNIEEIEKKISNKTFKINPYYQFPFKEFDKLFTDLFIFKNILTELNMFRFILNALKKRIYLYDYAVIVILRVIINKDNSFFKNIKLKEFWNVTIK